MKKPATEQSIRHSPQSRRHILLVLMVVCCPTHLTSSGLQFHRLLYLYYITVCELNHFLDFQRICDLCKGEDGHVPHMHRTLTLPVYLYSTTICYIYIILMSETLIK